MAFRVESPSGSIIVAGTGAGALGSKPYPDLPGAVQFAVDLAGVAGEYGAYNLICEISIAGSSLRSARHLYVFPPHSPPGTPPQSL